MPVKTKVVLTKKDTAKIINRLAHEIIEATPDMGDVVFVAIIAGGVPIAEKVAAAIKRYEDAVIPVGLLDISLYRDDLAIKKNQITIKESAMPFDLNKKNIILFDNVISSGRTVRAALDALQDYGRPSSIKLAVLIDRKHRELPIEANFVGKEVLTDKADEIVTDFSQSENVVTIIEK